MTTHNNNLCALARQALSGGAAPEGLPDSAELTRLANQFFQELPNAGEVEAIDTVPVSAASAAPVHAIPAGFSPRPGIDDSAIAALVQRSFSAPGSSELQKLAAAPLATPHTQTSGSSFYFLNEAFNLARVAQVPGLGSAPPPFDVHAVRARHVIRPCLACPI